jgi:hypothetical protein
MSLRWPLGVSRRAVLRGAGAALALPWLESLQGRQAKAQTARQGTRFLPIYLPNGAPELWKPAQTGSGAAWTLSSVLEPLAPLKALCTVLSGLENGSVFNQDGSSSVEPAHGRQPGAWLTCSNADEVAQRLGVKEANGVSADQVLARALGNQLGFASLQVGLSTTMSYCDGRACSLSRSVSWASEQMPAGKIVDPHEVFALLTGLADGGDDDAAKRRRAGLSSVLDAVKESAGVVRPKLSMADQHRLDQYLTSVGELEQRMPPIIPIGRGCEPSPLPPFPKLGPNEERRQTTADYDKGTHADLMNDLIVMAFQCNATRVVSYMLEDENSEFVYDHVTRRKFTAQGSVEDSGVCGSYSGAQHGSSDDFASITWWNVLKVSQLCQKLADIVEADGYSILDNTVVFLGSCMHGSNHACNDLPALLIGGGGGVLQTDRHVAFQNRPLRDLYFTLLNEVFGVGAVDFGSSAAGEKIATMAEILA